MKTITMLRSMGAAALALAALGTMSVAPAQDFSTRRTWVRGAHEQADGSLVDVQIRVDGRDTPLYFRPVRTTGTTSRRSRDATTRWCSRTTAHAGSAC